MIIHFHRKRKRNLVLSRHERSDWAGRSVHQKGGQVKAHILLSYIAYVLLWCIEHTHRSHGGTLTGRRVLDVLSGIELATITMRAGDGRKIALERISSPRTEEAQVLDTLGIRLPRKPRADKPPDLQLSLIDSGDQFSP